MSQFDLFREDGGEAKPWSDFVVDGIDTRPRKWVIIHNEFVLARLDWTIQMNRIFSTLVSQLAIDDDRFQLQRIRVKDLRDMAEVSNSNSINKQLADATQRLVREPIEFRTSDHRYEGHPIFSTCRYIPHEGYIEARFNDDAQKYLLQVKKSFTKYKLRTVMRLSTSYTVRFYQIAKMIQRDEGPRNRTIDIDDFRMLFMLTDKYDAHRDLRRYVIEPSVKEVNKKTQTKLKVDTVRKNESKYGAVTGLKWVVWPSTERKQPKAAQRLSLGPENPESNPDAFQKWFEGLDDKKQIELWKKAQNLVTEEGRDPRSAGFSGYVEVKLREITKDRRL